jgi:hypothetical protein
MSAPLIAVTLAGIRNRDAGSAVGVFTTIQQIAGAIGVAIIGVFSLASSPAMRPPFTRISRPACGSSLWRHPRRRPPI